MDLTSNVQFHGRWNLEGEDCYCTDWCGSSLFFQTTSRSVTVELGPLTSSRKNYHNILWRFGTQSAIRTALVRGKRSMKITPSDTIEPSHGGESLRDVTIMLCDWGASLHVTDIIATDGRAISAPAVGSPTRPMLFIGASLISGFSPPFGGLVLPHGSYQSFGSLVVRTLRSKGVDARLEMIAYPGTRLMTTNNSKGMIDIFWDGMNKSDGWVHRSTDIPKEIFICLGSDDKSWDADPEEFTQQYKKFVHRLKESYPESLRRIHIISPFGLFHNSSNPQSRETIYEPEVQNMVTELAESWLESDPDGPKIYHVPTEGWIDRTLTCDGLHPSMEGHENISNKLIEYLASLDASDAAEVNPSPA
ncbi:hypothetical protein BU17DRAFT_85617 [Hysterangium stoloniferum]|nr:hypothetical protein BU17DRAFT_85617 [Hysterangium stoloniferum]